MKADPLKYHRLLSEPTLVFKTKEDLFDTSPEGRMRASGLVGLLLPKRSHDAHDLDLANATGALELYLRNMIEACAYRVCIPAYGGSMWASPDRLKRLLSPSGKARLQFVDRRHSTWAAIEQYLLPAWQDLAEVRRLETEQDRQYTAHRLQRVAWNLYLLALATQRHCEVPLSVTETLRDIDHLGAIPALSSESRNRLSAVRGLFALFTELTDIPGFQCVADPEHSLRERIEDILEDAYLLEASHLRRFFGLKANIASVKRDLRKIVQFVAKNRPWAKGVIAATSYASPLAKSPAQVADALLDILPGLRLDGTAPLLVLPDAHSVKMRAYEVLSSRRIPFIGKESWCVVAYGRRKPEEDTQPPGRGDAEDRAPHP